MILSDARNSQNLKNQVFLLEKIYAWFQLALIFSCINVDRSRYQSARSKDIPLAKSEITGLESWPDQCVQAEIVP